MQVVGYNESGALQMSDVHIKLSSKNSSFRLTGGVLNNATIKNVLVENSCPFAYKTNALFASCSNTTIDGFILSQSFNDGKSANYYMGSDFSDFFVKYSTGKIGLSTMQAVGSFNMKVDENSLQEKGYQKIETA